MDSSSPQPKPSLPIDDKPTQQHLSTPTKPPSAPANSTTHIDAPPPPQLPDSAGRPRRCKTRASQAASPRNPRKPRRRFELEVREEKDSGLIEEGGKQLRKRRQTARTKKEKPNSVPPSTSSPKSEEESGGDFDRVGQMVSDLIMWKDASKSTFWFGFGSLCLLSSCFTQGLNFSIFSALSHFGILFLGISFLSNSICQGNMVEEKREIELKEDDILRLARLSLPALNFAISKTRALFSGEPSMTLKVVPFLLLGAEYGHLITIWRLCAIGFFISFSVPKLYSFYSAQINKRAECLKLWLLDAWSACTHKKKVLASVVMAFWNLSSIKTRIFTIFILFVLFRYLRQQVTLQFEDGEAQVSEKEQQKAAVMAEAEEKEPHQALVVREQGCQN